MTDTAMDLSDDELRGLIDKAREDVESARETMSDAAKWLREAQAKLNAFETLDRLRRAEAG